MRRFTVRTNTEAVSYYDQAFAWYLNKYVAKIYHARYIMIFTILFLATAYVAYSISQEVNYTQKYPIPIYFDEEVTHFANVSKIDQKGISTNAAVAKHMIEHYLKEYEDFDDDMVMPKKLEQKLRRVSVLSSAKTFNKFWKSLDLDAQKSKILKYRFGNSQKIKIQDISFARHDKTPRRAYVKYAVYSNINGVKSTHHKIIELEFIMSDITSSFVKSRSKFVFLVTDLKFNIV